MADNEDRESPPDTIVELDALSLSVNMGESTLWRTDSFAQEWFEDALREANTGADPNARRREIVFAVACAESYLFEWVRDKVLDRDFEKLAQYFPARQKKGAKDKWKEVLKQLKRDGVVPDIPDFSQQYWQHFVNLTDMRDDLVHSRSSRPETTRQPADMPSPHPSREVLEQLPAGWATKVVVELIKKLHEAVQTDIPPWLVVR